MYDLEAPVVNRRRESDFADCELTGALPSACTHSR